MRFMMIIYPGIEEAEWVPNEEAQRPMAKYNEQLTKAGILLAVNGLKAPSKGVRIRKAGGKPKVVDGPFTESKEVIGGFWILQVKSREEAVEWATRCPIDAGDILELRPIEE